MIVRLRSILRLSPPILVRDRRSAVATQYAWQYFGSVGASGVDVARGGNLRFLRKML